MGLITVGLVLDIIGAVILTSTTIMSKKEAVKRAGSYYAYEEGDKRAYKSPPVAGFIRDSRCATLGLVFLIVGFAVQIWGLWAG